MATVRPAPDPSLTGLPAAEKLDGLLLRRLAARVGPAPLRYALGRSAVDPADGSPVATLRFRDRRALLGLVLDPEVARTAMEEANPASPGAADPYDGLTDREKQVLKLVAEGKSNKEVAEVLGISVKTAMSHREHVMEKLGVHNRTELVRFAIRKGVIRVDE